ncbi:MAG: PAS domain-containing protein [Candidatus Hydrogenedentota bacterium]
MDMVVVVILCVSILIQVIAAVQALRLIGLTGHVPAWVGISVALLLMAVRRGITLSYFFLGSAEDAVHLQTEVVALGISALMLSGVSLLRPMFVQMQRHYEAQQVQQALYKELMDRLPHAVFLKDMDSRYRACNLQFAKEVGRTPAAVVGKHDEELFAPELAREYMRGDARVLDALRPLWFEESGERDGAPYHVLVLKAPFFDAGGELTGVLGIYLDITERVAWEETLREQEARFRAIADYTVGWESWVDPAGNLLWVNPGVERMLGYTPAECLAMTDYPIPLVAGSYQRAVRTRLQRVFAKPSSGSNVHLLLRHKRGHTVWGSVSWQAIYDDGGGFLGHRASVRDVTRERAVRIALKTSEARFRAVYENSPMPQFTWQRRHDYMMLVACNDAAVAATNGACLDNLGGTAATLYADRPDIVEDLRRCVEQRTSTARDMEYTAPYSGEVMYMAVVFGFCPPDLVIMYTLDRTELHHQAQQREQLIGELETALKQVKRLSGLLPICSGCKRIRNDNGYWEQVESYIRDHAGVEFSHGLCPECAHRLYPDLMKELDNEDK